MPMWLVWVLLVIAALVYLGWAMRRLWHAGKALAAELKRASVVTARLEARIAELEEIAARSAQIAPEIVLTPDRRRELKERRAQVKRIRRARRWARYERMSARWDDVTGPRG